MEWNEDAIGAARSALRTVGDAIDEINTKATQLEGLLIALMHAARSDNLPLVNIELALWLASDVASHIKSAAQRLG